MRAAIIPNYDKNGVEEILIHLEDSLAKNGIEYITVTGENDFDGCDFIITIGGDGTIIHAAKSGARFGLPILGINNGRLGYLADITPAEIDRFFEIKNGNYIIEERMLLEVETGGEKYYCLNDAVISKGALSRMIDIEVKADGCAVPYRADGLIAATPTGSTAYSMSAGGPVVDPQLGLILITPICSNSLFDRPILFSDKTVFEINVRPPKDTTAYLTVDGEFSVEIDPNIPIYVRRADTTAKLMRIHRHSFCKTLTEKMRG